MWLQHAPIRILPPARPGKGQEKLIWTAIDLNFQYQCEFGEHREIVICIAVRIEIVVMIGRY